MSNSKKFVAKNGVQTKNILFVSTDEANNTNLTVLNSGDGLYYTYDDDFNINCGTLSFRNTRPSIELDGTVNASFTTDELISKNRALLFSMLF